MNQPSRCRHPAGALLVTLLLAWAASAGPTAARPDIRTLGSHFQDPKRGTGSWQFLPSENIRELSLTEHPGLVTLREAGKGKDVRGILRDPIRISDYPLPWEFHLGLVQNHLALKGLSEKQINHAIGLNLMVTFSEPSTWPRDRSRPPPDARSMQLFVVHLGNQGENYRLGVPQLKRSELNFGDHSPEAYFVYGRGDLAPSVNGNWRMGYTWVGPDPAESGTWSKRGGPADAFVRFRLAMSSPTTLQVGVGYGQHPGWRMRTIDVSRFGKITGIWEVGPIVSLDRWIPDVLSRELRLDPPAWLEGFKQRQKVLAPPGTPPDEGEAKLAEAFRIEPPDPQFEYYVDYAVFYGNGPENIEHLSDEFDVPGFLADQKFYVEGSALTETFSHPGYLTATLYGVNGSWAMCPILQADGVSLTRRKPPFELECAFIPPGPEAPWNLWWNIGLYDRENRNHSWQPGIKYAPGKGLLYFNQWSMVPDRVEPNPEINPTFSEPLARLLPAQGKVHFLIQIPDERHARVGVRSAPNKPWFFSSAFEASPAFGSITKLAYPCLVSFQGSGTGGKGWGAGNYPGYQTFLIDYWRLRYSLSK